MSQILIQAEELRKQAIGILITERQEIDRQLALLGADGTETPITKRKACSVRASPDHNARFHKKDSGGAPIPTTQPV